MKRLWIPVTLLVLIFSAALYNTAQVSRITETISGLLNQSEAAVAQADWETAAQLTQEAMEQWEKTEDYFSIVLCHADIDEVSTAFQEVMGFLQYQSAPEYDSANGTLVEKVKHLAEIEALNWKNLL